MHDIQTPATVIFFGRSGCGKGTQAHLLQSLLESDGRTVLYVETGAELRKLAESDTYIGTKTKQTMMQGDFVPAFVPVWAWADRFVHEFTGTEDLILDGLSRKFAEAPILDSALKYFGRNTVYVIHIEVSREWSIQKLMARGRSDDTPERIAHRLEAFEHEVPMVIDYFAERKGYGIIRVNGEQAIDQVQSDIWVALKTTSFLC